MLEIPIAAAGVLRDFCEAGMLRLADFHVARRLAQLAGEADPTVTLALALAVRELRLGSVCLDLVTAEATRLPEWDYTAPAQSTLTTYENGGGATTAGFRRTTASRLPMPSRPRLPSSTTVTVT